MIQEIHHLTEDSELYPPLLREIEDPPKKLFVRGNLKILSHPKLLAVVGSRKANNYGKQAIHKVLSSPVSSGLPLVSGLAYGIDSIAHALCLEKNTPTIAVLGSGIDDQAIYPKANIQLAHQIISSGGAVISEYSAGTPPYPKQFPARNRIIAGLSIATLVVQAADRSGSLITARLALESGRDVYAVPGPINDALSSGTNKLIQQGAPPILNSEDIINHLEIEKTTNAKLSKLTNEQLKILALLSSFPLHLDIISKKTDLPTADISAILIELELLDKVRNVGSLKYIKT